MLSSVKLVKRSLLLAASVALAGVASPATAQQPAPRPLPPLPGQYAPPPPAAGVAVGAPGGAAPSALSPQEVYEHVRRGVVAIERNGVPLAIGTVLGGDGRILTALSGLGGAEGADVRYADGTSVHAKVGHSDRDADLALLVPLGAKWTDGLVASEADPVNQAVRAMLPGKGAHLGPAEAAVKGRTDAHARDGLPLPQMLDVDLKGAPIPGAPLLDPTGNVVGVLVRACKGALSTPAESPWAAWGNPPPPPPKAACTPVVLGEPVNAIRSFLSRTPATAVAPAPWMGVRGETEAEGPHPGGRPTAVAPQGPAEKAGLRPTTDVIVAVDGQPIDSTEKLAEAVGRHAPGDTVKLLVFGEGKFRDASVTLRAAP